MKSESISVFISIFMVMLATTTSNAAEMDHSKMDHSGHNMHGPAIGQPKSGATGKLKNLSTMPPSGRAREAGSDGRYAMESTTVDSSLEVKCAQATRGIIMLDNATWKRCGGKPKGASMGVDKPAEGDHQHMHH